MVLYSNIGPDLSTAIQARNSLKVPKHPPKTIWPINGRNHDICVYITASANQGGVYCIPGFLKTFLKKIRFLSDQEVPGRHKNIYRELRRFLQDLKFLATSVAFLGNRRNTCCHRWVREVQRGPCGNSWEK